MPDLVSSFQQANSHFSKKHRIYFFKSLRAVGVTQPVRECLSSKHEALSSNPSVAKMKKKFEIRRDSHAVVRNNTYNQCMHTMYITYNNT
jgi:hypothetical protein